MARIAEATGVAHAVRFTGALAYEDVGAFMNRAALFVLPAYREPFGLVLLEALACGCRVITTNQAGPASFIPQALRATGDAVLVPGLSSITPPEIESAGFVERLTDELTNAFARPLHDEQRLAISRQIDHLTWDAHVATLARLYRVLSTPRAS